MKKIVSKLILYLMGWKVVSDIPQKNTLLLSLLILVIGISLLVDVFGYMLEIEAKYLGKSQLFPFLMVGFFVC